MKADVSLMTNVLIVSLCSGGGPPDPPHSPIYSHFCTRWRRGVFVHLCIKSTVCVNNHQTQMTLLWWEGWPQMAWSKKPPNGLGLSLLRVSLFIGPKSAPTCWADFLTKWNCIHSLYVGRICITLHVLLNQRRAFFHVGRYTISIWAEVSEQYT